MVPEDKEIAAAIERAKYFFEHDYRDRGMVKWQGYYLSDHTEDVQSYSAKRRAAMNTKLMSEMDMEEISGLLFRAYKNNLVVLYQEKYQDQYGNIPAIQTSKVLGYVENKIVFEKNRQIDLANIQWCELQ